MKRCSHHPMDTQKINDLQSNEIEIQMDQIKVEEHQQNSHQKFENEPTHAHPPTQIQSRSLKKKVPDLQISFEETFMEEHQLALQKAVQNFIESSFSQLKDQEEYGKTFWKESNSFELGLFSLAENPFLQQLEKEQISKDLETENKLKMLLELIFQKTSSQVTHELTYIASLIWEKYLEDKKIYYYRHSDLLRTAQSFTEGQIHLLFDDHRLQLLNFSQARFSSLKPKIELKKVFQHFLEFWATTVLLVIEEYFENPFSEPEQARRRQRSLNFGEYQDFSSSDCDSFLGKPVKILRF